MALPYFPFYVPPMRPKRYAMQAKDIDSEVTGRSTGHPVRCIRNKMTREYLRLEKEGASFEDLEHLTLGSLRNTLPLIILKFKLLSLKKSWLYSQLNKNCPTLRGMAAAIMLGAEAVQMGTVFVTAKESIVHSNYNLSRF